MVPFFHWLNGPSKSAIGSRGWFTPASCFFVWEVCFVLVFGWDFLFWCVSLQKDLNGRKDPSCVTALNGYCSWCLAWNRFLSRPQCGTKDCFWSQHDRFSLSSISLFSAAWYKMQPVFFGSVTRRNNDRKTCSRLMVLYITFVTFEVDIDVPSFPKSVGYGMILFPAWMSQEFS